MSAELELDAAQALFAARALEASVHDEGPWFMRWGDLTVPAVRRVSGRKVFFAATFPEACWLGDQGTGVVLLCREEIMGIKTMNHPGDTAFVVTWTVGTEWVEIG